jgi:hypothetical protein
VAVSNDERERVGRIGIVPSLSFSPMGPRRNDDYLDGLKFSSQVRL